MHQTPSPSIIIINVGRHSLGSWLHNYLVTTVVLGLVYSYGEYATPRRGGGKLIG